ncbi:helix-turn-helix domain-containing protein [Nocardioides daejeonensis]|uniref:helix-turn-helix domain-containing protein n=1 Tax=Nocardioides daejeonensis TaxID=1046556 RepID=UPI0013A53F25|nr:XRE family transcriptional regulator [Nocardioides daejeonensis]
MSELEATDDGAVDDTAQTMREVGAQIRRLRKRRNMTLQALGDATGTSVSMLSMLERGVATPSISTLVSVASALGTHMSDLFGAGGEQRSPVRRLADQVEVHTSSGVLRRLVHNDPSRGLEMVVNEYEPGTGSGPEPSHHDGAEFGIVLSGTLTIQVNGVDHVLSAGDAIHYPSTTPHLIRNDGHGKARAVWVNLDE